MQLKIYRIAFRIILDSIYPTDNARRLGFSVGPGKPQGDQEGLELNGTRQLLVYDKDFNLVDENVSTINKKRYSLHR